MRGTVAMMCDAKVLQSRRQRATIPTAMRSKRDTIATQKRDTHIYGVYKNTTQNKQRPYFSGSKSAGRFCFCVDYNNGNSLTHYAAQAEHGSPLRRTYVYY